MWRSRGATGNRLEGWGWGATGSTKQWWIHWSGGWLAQYGGLSERGLRLGRLLNRVLLLLLLLLNESSGHHIHLWWRGRWRLVTEWRSRRHHPRLLVPPIHWPGGPRRELRGTAKNGSTTPSTHRGAKHRELGCRWSAKD